MGDTNETSHEITSGTSGPHHDSDTSSGTVQPVRPVEQDTVTLFGHTVRAVRLPDGRVAAVFSDLTRALGLVRSPQARRVREDATISDQLIPALIADDGGTEGKTEGMSEVLTAWAIPTWLTGIRLSMLTPEKRPTILAFKREAADVLYRHFSQRERAGESQGVLGLPAPESAQDLQAMQAMQIGVPTPPEQPAPPPLTATLDERIAYHEAMLAFLHWQQEVETWHTMTDARLDGMAALEQRVEIVEAQIEAQMEQVEEITRLMPEMLERLGSQPLTPKHQYAVQQGVDLLADLTGKRHAMIYDELRRSFHVAKYDQLPEARWAEVIAWFRPRIQAAERQAGTKAKHHPFDEEMPEQGSLF